MSQMKSRRRVTPGLIVQALAAVPVRLLRPVVVIRLVRFHTAFGFVLRSPFYYLLLRAAEQKSRNRKYFDLGFWWGPTPSADLAQLWGRYIRLAQEPVPGVISRALNVIAWHWQRRPAMKEHVLDFTTTASCDSELMNDAGYSATSLLSSREHRDVVNCLEELDVRDGSPLALLHVRNSSHDTQSQGSDNYDVECVNADPAQFQSTVDFLRDTGYNVLTVGNHPMSASGLRDVVEYHRSKARSPLRDFTLGSVSNLYVGTTAGALFGVAINFRVPSLLTNHLVWNSNATAEPFGYGRAVLLLKNVFWNDKIMTHSECLVSGLPISDRGLAARSIRVQDNSPEEILNSLKFLISLGDSEERWQDARASAEQLTFWKVFDQHATLPRVCKNSGAVIAPDFLTRHQQWLH